MTSSKKPAASDKPNAELRAAAGRVARRLEQANAAGEPFPEHWGGELEKLLGAPKRSEGWTDRGAESIAIAYQGLLPLARDARMPPHLLERIHTALGEGRTTATSSSARRLAAALAGNPNLPAQNLTRHAGANPKAFCRNPAVPLAVLEDPTFVRGISASDAARLLRRADVPTVLLAAYAAGHAGNPRPDWPDTAEEARLHVRLAGELAPGEWEEKVRTFWQKHAAALPEWRERNILLDLAALGLTPPGWERAIGRDRDKASAEEHSALLRRACDPGTSSQKLTEIAENMWSGPDAALRIALVLNPSTPDKAREGLRRRWGRDILLTPVESVEEALIICQDLICRNLRSESSDRMPLVTYLILTNFGQPRRQPPSRYTGTLTARHRSATNSDDWRMRLAAALTLSVQNPKSARYLTPLTEDGNQLVRAAAKARLANPTAEVSVL